MNKLQSLRDALAGTFAHLAENPQALSVFVVSGQFGAVLSNPGEPMHLGYAYTARVLLIDFAGDLREVTAVLWDWIRVHQPDLAQNPQRRDRVVFEVELLANDLADVQIDIPLTESAICTPRPEAGFEIATVAEPGPDAVIAGAGWDPLLELDP